jgi:GNAT superfamily N-acetyltransferase
MEWGVREMLVEDPDGHRIRFGHGASVRKQSAALMPSNIHITARTPSIEEYRNLINAVGWQCSSNNAMVEKLLKAALFAVVAEDSDKSGTIGCALLLGDDASFYYVKDVVVHPQWQCKQIGTALMQELTKWLESHAQDHSLVGLFTGDNLAPFYKQFGFSPAFGMTKRIQR